jgi:exosortase/archaeosortase family protein
LVCGALSPMVPHLVCGKNISAVPLAVGEGYAIYHSKHSIIIGLGCGGMEGVYFFLFASVLILMAHGERCHLLEGVLFMSVGAAGIYLMNTLRICIYYLAVLAVAFCAGNSSSFLAAEILFHNALGWILYGAYLVLYLKTWSILLLAREQKSPIFFRPKRLFQV